MLNHDPANTWIVALTDYAAYLDDSGHPDDQEYVIVAGFIGSEEQWRAFEQEWPSALERNHLSNPFHMTDFEREYRHSKRRGSILQDLTTTIREHTCAALIAAVEMASYRKVNAKYPLEECMGKPIALVARIVATQMDKWKAEIASDADHLLSFMEQGSKHRGDIEEVFRRDNKPLPIPIPKDHPCAQAADVFAWEALQFAKTGKPRRSLINLLKDQNVYEGMMREQNLIQSCKNAKTNVERSDLPPNLFITFHSNPKKIRKRSIK